MLLDIHTHRQEPFSSTMPGSAFIQGEWNKIPQRSERKGRVSVHRVHRDAGSKGLELFVLGQF